MEELIKERFRIANSIQSRFVEVTDLISSSTGRIAINRYLTDDHYYITMDREGIYLNWE